MTSPPRYAGTNNRIYHRYMHSRHRKAKEGRITCKQCSCRRTPLLSLTLESLLTTHYTTPAKAPPHAILHTNTPLILHSRISPWHGTLFEKRTCCLHIVSQSPPRASGPQRGLINQKIRIKIRILNATPPPTTLHPTVKYLRKHFVFHHFIAPNNNQKYQMSLKETRETEKTDCCPDPTHLMLSLSVRDKHHGYPAAPKTQKKSINPPAHPLHEGRKKTPVRKTQNNRSWSSNKKPPLRQATTRSYLRFHTLHPTREGSHTHTRCASPQPRGKGLACLRPSHFSPPSLPRYIILPCTNFDGQRREELTTFRNMNLKKKNSHPRRWLLQLLVIVAHRPDTSTPNTHL